MRILVAAEQWFPDYAGGSARVVRATAEALAQHGHEITVLVPRASGEAERAIVNGVDVRRVIRRSLLPQTATDVYETRRAIKTIGMSAFDLVLAHHVVSAAGALSLRPSCPVVLVFHSSPLLEARHRRSLGLSPHERLRSLAVEPMLYMLEHASIRRADRILVLSEFSRQLLAENHPDSRPRVHVVGGGVDLQTFTPALDRDALRARMSIGAKDKLLLTVRRLVGRMGIDMLLDSMSDLHEHDPNIRLIIIGDGELRATLEQRRDQLGLTERVRFVGRIPDSELRDWYCAADLFVLPTVAFEGFGMVTAEALACGTPVVGTPVGATGELLDQLNPALVARSVDAASLAATVRHALTLIGPRFRLACYDHARRHLSWENAIGRWELALREATCAGLTIECPC